MRRAFLAGLVVSAVSAQVAGAAPPPAGSLVQLGAPTACWANAAVGGCSADPFAGFLRPLRVEASSDGLDLYVANQGGKVGRFRRDRATGALTPAAPAATSVTPLSLNDLALAPGGTRLVTAAGDTSGGGRAQLFARSADGTLSLLGCADEVLAAPCTEVDGLGGAAAVALPASGPGIYVAGELGGGDGPDGGALGDGALVALTAEPVAQLRCIPAVASTVPGDACSVAGQPALGGVAAVAVSPDAMHVYAGGFEGIAGFSRDPGSGQLGGEVACLRRLTGAPQCPLQANLGIPEDLAFSPDGAFLYVAGRTQVTVLARQPAGGALSFVECFNAAGDGGCTALAGLQGAEGVSVSSDGRYVAVVGGTSLADQGEVRTLRRDAATGRLAPAGCASFAGTGGCSHGDGLRDAQGVSSAPDGPHVYVASHAGTATGDVGALAAFRIEVAPACASASASVPAGSGAALPLSCPDTDGDPVTRTILTPPAHGSLGAVDDAAGTVSYTPAIDYTGPDSVTFKATDGANESPPATISITVTPPLDALPRSRIVGLKRSVRRRSLRSFHGRASDDRAVRRVQVVLLKIEGRARAAVIRRCRTLTLKGGLRLTEPDGLTCRARPFLPAKGATRWTFRLKRRLPRGRYVVYSRAVDSAGQAERAFSAARGNRVAFRVR